VVVTTKRDFAREQRNAVTDKSDQSLASQAVQNAALDYVIKLRKQNRAQYERPQVALMQKEAGKCHPIEDIKKAAREELKKARQTDKAVNKGSMLRTERVQSPVKAHGADLSTVPNASSALSLPPRDSPLTKVFLGQYLSKLVQETITYRKTRYSDLAHGMSMSEIVLQEAVQGNLPLTRGRWVRFGQLLGLATTFEVRETERDGTPCWELCYPPIRVGQPTQW
jgi:hypothetical protein